VELWQFSGVIKKKNTLELIYGVGGADGQGVCEIYFIGVR
jgi:hypothetical protein